LSAEKKPTAAFILSVLSGILILVFSGFMSMMWWMFGPSFGGMMGFGGIMGFAGMMMFAMSILSIVFGIIILLGGFMLYNRPEQAQTWGILILVFSILSLFGGGGAFIGSILGIIGGLLAMTWRG